MKKPIYIILFFSALALIVWEFLPIRRTSVYRYSGVLGKWESRELVDHFPKSIPDNATKVSFSSSEGFLQAGSHIQIKFQLPSNEIRSIYDIAMQNAKQYHDGGNSVTLPNSRKDGLASTDPHTFEDAPHEFPKDFRTFVFHAESTSQWNHGETKGVVISLERNEVIYYAELW